MPLTRFLYMVDEVIHTFLETLLKRKDITACYFWISEYYYSGFKKKTWQLLWKIFYDFYAIKHPKLETILLQWNLKWLNNKTISPILSVVKNLFERKSCCDVFLARISKPSLIHEESPKWLEGFTNKSLALSIHQCCTIDMSAILTKELSAVVLQYFREVHKMSLKECLWMKIPYKDKKHIILALIHHLYMDAGKIDLYNKSLKVSPDDITWINEINSIPIDPLYKTLPIKRLYSISPTIGCFGLSRFCPQYPSMKHLLGFHWQYFASFSPLWKKRFTHATRNRKEMCMIFENDDVFEQFHELYDYEPDEQTQEVQERSIREIKECSPREWIRNIFGKEYMKKQLLDIYFE
jgi:hypothetical protein